MKAPALLLCLAAVATLTATTLHASDVRFNLGVTVPAVPIQVAAYSPPRVIIEPPVFLPLPGLGFSAAVDTPYDIFSIGSFYYLKRGDVWLRARSHEGPWLTVGYRKIPWQLRRHPLERIRTVREIEYRRHAHKDHHDNGRHRGWDRDDRHDGDRWADNRRWSDREDRSPHREHARGDGERSGR